MYRVMAFAGLAFVYASIAFAIDQKPDTINVALGGLRQANAVLTVSKHEYLVQVRMIPVRCFDDATNARLNREKGRELALFAVAKYLSGKEFVEFTVSGAQIEKTGTDSKFFSLNLRVPRDGVCLVKAGEKPGAKPKPGEDRLAFSSELFTRKRDYLNTLGQLIAVVSTDVKIAEDRANNNSDASFIRAIAEIDERGRKNFASLEKEIKADLLLFSIEQVELNEATAKQQASMLLLLKKALKQHETKRKTKEELP